jgi:hypothetical protein
MHRMKEMISTMMRIIAAAPGTTTAEISLTFDNPGISIEL